MNPLRLALVSLALLFHGGCAFTRSSDMPNPVVVGTEAGETSSSVLASGTRKGEKDARREIRAGTLAQETYGMFGEPSAYEKFLTAHGVAFRWVDGCCPDDQTVGHADGFNRVMKEEIRKKLGPDFFEKAEAECYSE